MKIDAVSQPKGSIFDNTVLLLIPFKETAVGAEHGAGITCIPGPISVEKRRAWA